ncbi:MAG TPA: ISKra4 family transposase [Bryobacteraceae bacterium]
MLAPCGGNIDARGKKTAEAIRREVAQEVDQLLRIVFQERRKTGRLDLEATEMALRSAMHHAGATALNELLRFPAPAVEQRRIPCSCGHQAGYQELRSKPVLTAVGEVTVSRPYYLCAHCHRGQFPADAELDIENTELSPGVRRMQAIVGQDAPFDRGRQQMKLLAGLEVTTKSVERTAEAVGEDIAVCEQAEIQRAMQLDLPIVVGEPIPILYVQVDGTGVPVVRKETVGRQGKTEGQLAHTREAKLGCVFTQTAWDEEGHAIRDPDSTTYVGAIETAEEFGKRIYLEAWKRGWSRAQTKVFMGDGSEWIWNIAQLHFPGAIQIVDLFHARQHLWDLARKLHPNREAEQRRWMMVHQDLLDGGKIEGLVSALRAIDSLNSEVADKIRVEAGYFENNRERMRYPQFRGQHLFVGTGVIEAGCKTLIGSRCKQSGMFWTVRGANAILALRCCQLNGRFEDYWEARRG